MGLFSCFSFSFGRSHRHKNNYGSDYYKRKKGSKFSMMGSMFRSKRHSYSHSHHRRHKRSSWS